jgi:WD40 repeat protein
MIQNFFLGDPYGSYHTAELTCMSISSTSTLALTGSVDGSVYIVNINTGRVCVFIAFDFAALFVRE